MLMSTNAAIGIALNLDVNSLKNYVLSFRRFNKQDSMYMIVDQITKDMCKEFFYKNYVTVIDFDLSPWWNKLQNLAPINLAIAVACKYMLIQKFIHENPQIKNILLTDVKDVVFQSNPFVDLPDSYFYAFAEDSNFSIVDQIGNRTWNIDIYGEEFVMKNYKDKLILCNGTTMGSADCMLKFCQLYEEEFFSLPPSLVQNQYVDQPILNHICHFDLAKTFNCTIKKNGDLCGTLTTTFDAYPSSFDKVSIDVGSRTHNYVCRVNGQIPAFLHQYVHNPLVKYAFDSMYTDI